MKMEMVSLKLVLLEKWWSPNLACSLGLISVDLVSIALFPYSGGFQNAVKFDWTICIFSFKTRLDKLL